MKNTMLILLAVISLTVYAQTDKDTLQDKPKKFYSSVGGEWIFSFANTNTDIETTNLRFSAWYHVQYHWHYDFHKYAGGFFGLGSRNIGYVSTAVSNNVYAKGFTEYNAVTGQYELNSDFKPGDEIGKIKRRAYTIGIPVGLKFGKLKDNLFMFMGGEIELPFHFKNKIWVDGEKYKRTEWFSKQTSDYLLSAFVGFQFPWGANIKFKWYFNDFMNPDYTDGSQKPFENLDSQMFYFSFGMNMFNSQASVKQLKSLDKTKKEQQSYSL